jgi:hypothetical protein
MLLKWWRGTDNIKPFMEAEGLWFLIVDQLIKLTQLNTSVFFTAASIRPDNLASLAAEAAHPTIVGHLAFQ